MRMACGYFSSDDRDRLNHAEKELREFSAKLISYARDASTGARGPGKWSGARLRRHRNDAERGASRTEGIAQLAWARPHIHGRYSRIVSVAIGDHPQTCPFSTCAMVAARKTWAAPRRRHHFGSANSIFVRSHLPRAHLVRRASSAAASRN
jgi:hypothetical protein